MSDFKRCVRTPSAAWRLVLPIALALVLLIPAGCAPAARPTIGTPPAPGVAVMADRVALTGARAFAAAELAYITAADGAGRLARAGVIRGAAATRLRALNMQARSLLAAGRSSVDVAEKAQAAAALFGLVDQLKSIGRE